MATKQGYLGAQITNTNFVSTSVTMDSGEFPVKITGFSGTLYASNASGNITVELLDGTGSNAYTMATLPSSGTLVMVLGNNSPTYSAAAVRCYNLAGKAIYIRVRGLGYIQTNDTQAKRITIETSTKQSYTLTLAKGTGISAVSGGGSVQELASTAISATVATGYTFSKWTSNNGGTFANANAASTTFTMPVGNVTATASATVNSYTLTVSAGTGGTASGGGTVAYGGTASISATASAGYSFAGWSSNNGGSFANASSASTTFTMPAGNCTVTASFSKNSYTLTTGVSPASTGSVTAGGTIQYGSTKSLTATAASGYSFSSWSVSGGGSVSSTTANPTTFTMGTSNATVTANFVANSYTLTVSKGTGISSVTGGGSVKYGSSNSISATASSGYTFSGWSSNNGGSFGNSGLASTTFVMPVGNTTVTASATANSYTLTVAKGTGISSVSGGGSKKYTSSNAISATASTGYSFKNWTSNNGGTFANANSASTNFTMPIGNTTVTANAQVNSYTLTVSAGTGGTASGGGSVNYGASKSISASASTGYSFKNWTSNNGGSFANANSASTTFTMPAGNTTVTANFTHNSYTLSKASNPSAGGSVTLGSTSGYYGTEITISASAATGYQFTGWTTTGGTIANASAASTKITMPAANATVTASFSKIDYTVSKASSPSAGGTVTTSKTTANYGDSITISASPATGYAFSSWSTSPSVSISNNSFTMPASNITVTANFTKVSFTVNKASNPAAGGTVTTSSATADYGSTVTISATANTGYTFSSWSSSPTVTITDNKFTMPESDITITANFTHNSYTLTGLADPVAGGSMTMSKQTAYYGDSITLTATEATGYRFDRWVTSPSVTINNNVFSMPNENISVTAKFAKVDYSVTCVSDPSGAGSVSATPSTAQMGDTVTLSQTPSVEYAFDGFTVSPAVTISSNQFIMPASNVTVTASYHLVPSEASLDASSYEGGDTATLSITAVSPTFTHKYRLAFDGGPDTGWVDVAQGVTSVGIYIPVKWQLLLHGATTATGGVLTLQTYSGTFLVGSDTISNLTYTALDDTAISLTSVRSDSWGNAYKFGKFALYSISKPDSITQYSLTYDGTTVASPAVEGTVLPGDRRFVGETSTLLTLTMVYGTETITVVSSVPGYQKITKNIDITEG